MTETGSSPILASWIERFGALLVDYVPLVVLFGVLTALFGKNEAWSDGFSFELSGGAAFVYYAGVLGWFVYNWIIRQGRTGQTLGKKQLGIAVFKVGTTTPLGPGVTFVRQLAHILDGIPCLIGYLWPLWDSEKRTFADMIIGSRVYKV